MIVGVGVLDFETNGGACGILRSMPAQTIPNRLPPFLYKYFWARYFDVSISDMPPMMPYVRVPAGLWKFT